MVEKAEQENTQRRLTAFTAAFEEGALHRLRAMVNGLHPAEIAHLIQSLPPEQRLSLWELVSQELEGEVVLHMSDEVRASFINSMDDAALIKAAENFDTDDLADILHELPDSVINEVLQSLTEQDRSRLAQVLSYPDDTAGGLMNTDTITVRPHVTVDVVLRYLRRKGEVPAMTEYLIVVNRMDQFLGLLPLSSLLTKDPSSYISELMVTDIEPIPATLSASDVAALFQDKDLVTAPVVDEHGKLLGRITIDDVVDVIRTEAEHSLMSMAGLDEEDDMFASVTKSARRRSLWLGLNLITALLASWVIGLFGATIEQMVALAVLMPVVASMGGIAGSQTLTLVIRGVALGRVGSANARLLLQKEVAVGCLNGVLWAIIISAIAMIWFGDSQLGVVIAAAIFVNLVVAAFCGATIPLILQKFGADPALAGSVVLTTITDVVGFFVFLGLASVWMF